jgi:hypothetical protein
LAPRWQLPDPIDAARQAEARRRTLAAMGVQRRGDLKPEQQQAYWKKYRSTLRKLVKAQWKPEPADQAVLDKHAIAAIKHLRKATKLGETDGLYHLGLASILEQYAQRAEARRLNIETLDPYRDRMKRPEGTIKRQWLSEAMKQYGKAFEAGSAKAEQLDHRPAAGIRSLVSYEAVNGYQRIATADDRIAGDNDLMKRMAAHLEALKDLPRGPITPIVFATRQVQGIESLINDDAAVAFDLDGTGRVDQRWQWINADAVLLVWDPQETGRVTSGRQLFGSVSWWLLPADGFRAMALLDDDGDGWLTGDERRGLAGWRDRDGDGVSQPGEVTPLQALGIEAIATEATARDRRHPVHQSGLRLNDGQTLPVWDWLAEPAAPRD